MKNFNDILCRAFFTIIGLVMTDLEVMLMDSSEAVRNLFSWIPDDIAIQWFILACLFVGLYNINKTIIWKAIQHFNTK